MREAVSFINEDDIFNLNRIKRVERGTLKEVHIADIHFGAFNAKTQYNILKEQFIDKISNLDFDILSINGDLYDHKFMSNSDPVMYATLFVDECIRLCRDKNATFVIINGTLSHDENQLKLFYHYLNDKTVDVRIIEDICFQYIKGAKVLCIPEMNNCPKEKYEHYLFNSGPYDSCFVHGEILGSIYREKGTEPGFYDNKPPIFSIEDFKYCLGPIISGHVHVPGCFSSHYYYCGSPLRWQFGEEQKKGFYVLLHNLDTSMYYIKMEEIKSFRYDTININDLFINDPTVVTNYVEELQSNGVDYIKLKLDRELTGEEIANIQIAKKYYATNKFVKIELINKKKDIIELSKEKSKKYDEYDFIFDKKLSPEQIFTMYVNKKENCEFISVEELKELLKEEI